MTIDAVALVITQSNHLNMPGWENQNVDVMRRAAPWDVVWLCESGKEIGGICQCTPSAGCIFFNHLFETRYSLNFDMFFFNSFFANIHFSVIPSSGCVILFDLI